MQNILGIPQGPKVKPLISLEISVNKLFILQKNISSVYLMYKHHLSPVGTKIVSCLYLFEFHKRRAAKDKGLRTHIIYT